jgi:hypothetical protein
MRGVSRTQIRKMFVAAERLGYVALSARGGMVTEIRAPLWKWVRP